MGNAYVIRNNSYIKYHGSRLQTLAEKGSILKLNMELVTRRVVSLNSLVCLTLQIYYSEQITRQLNPINDKKVCYYPNRNRLSPPINIVKFTLAYKATKTGELGKK